MVHSTSNNTLCNYGVTKINEENSNEGVRRAKFYSKSRMNELEHISLTFFQLWHCREANDIFSDFFGVQAVTEYKYNYYIGIHIHSHGRLQHPEIFSFVVEEWIFIKSF